MSFSVNNTQRWVSFCANYSQPAAVFNITLQLGGDNAASYQLSNNFILITIAAAPALNITPTQTLTVLDAQKTYARIQVTTNLPGYFYYHMNLAPFTTPYTASAIKAAIKANSLII